MTKEALQKLPEKCKHYLEVQADLAKRAQDTDKRAEYHERSMQMQAYLQCLCDMETITQAEARSVHIFYTSK